MKKAIQKVTSQHIIGEGAVREFIYACIFTFDLGIGFHPDTYFYEYENNACEKTFSSDEAAELDNTMAECFSECDKLGLDIYEISLETAQPIIDKLNAL